MSIFSEYSVSLNQSLNDSSTYHYWQKVKTAHEKDLGLVIYNTLSNLFRGLARKVNLLSHKCLNSFGFFDVLFS